MICLKEWRCHFEMNGRISLGASLAFEVEWAALLSSSWPFLHVSIPILASRGLCQISTDVLAAMIKVKFWLSTFTPTWRSRHEWRTPSQLRSPYCEATEKKTGPLENNSVTYLSRALLLIITWLCGLRMRTNIPTEKLRHCLPDRSLLDWIRSQIQKS